MEFERGTSPDDRDESQLIRLSNGDFVAPEDLSAYYERLAAENEQSDETHAIPKGAVVGSALGLLGIGLAIGGRRAYKHLRERGDN